MVNFISCSVTGLTANCLLYTLHKGSGMCELVKMSVLLDNRNLGGDNDTNQKIGNFMCSGHSPSSEHHPQEHKVPELLDGAHKQDGDAED